MKTNKKHLLKREEGFTLVEVIAVLIILGILAAVAVPKYIGLEDNAKERAIDAAVSELNGRESMYWAKLKISTNTTTSWTSATLNTQIWTEMTNDAVNADGTTCGTCPTGIDLDTTKGGTEPYKWEVAPTASGGSLSFQKSKTYALARDSATLEHPAIWKRVIPAATP